MSTGKREILKILAVATMLIDHIGRIGYPDVIAFQAIGRVGFPLFAALLAQGFLHTSNLKKYSSRLLAFAFVSQIPYMLAMPYPYRLNIFFTLWLGVVALRLLRDDKKTALYFLLLALFLSDGAFVIDYGLYGIATILLFYLYFREKISPVDACIIFSLLNVYAVFVYNYPIQLIGILSFFLVNFVPENIKFNFRFPKYFYYVFYPAHILILYFIFK